MILYSYECKTCGTFDSLATPDTAHRSQSCPVCALPAEQVIMGTGGTPWVTKHFNDPAFPSAWGRWESDRRKRYNREVAREARDK